MATLIWRNPAPGSILAGTPGNDRIIVDWASGIIVTGQGGRDDLRSAIPDPYAVSDPHATYATMYGDQFVFGSPHPDRLEGNARARDVLAGGYGWIMKGGAGPDDYEVHGNAPRGPLICSLPQIDIREDTLLVDHSRTSRAPDGFRLDQWDIVRLDADTWRVTGVRLHAFSANPIVREQWVDLGFAPTGHNDARTYHNFDVGADTLAEAQAAANAELHAMARHDDFILA